ncbi:MAG: TlpA family protein disulfide reductase [Bacteroidetes bacterium]|nr:TlpA family protein disulfide reductase [Bacteroidota bacterium]
MKKAYLFLISTVGLVSCQTGYEKTAADKQMAKMLASLKMSEVGEVAPEFSAQSLGGKTVSFADYSKGKVVLIDFWASWCVYCREENPNLVKTYEKYKGKGFEVLGVSLDDSKAKWAGAVQADGLSWEQVSDQKGWNSDIAAMYGVQALPMNFLIGRDGKILAKDLRGEQLQKVLDEVLR